MFVGKVMEMRGGGPSVNSFGWGETGMACLLELSFSNNKNKNNNNLGCE